MTHDYMGAKEEREERGYGERAQRGVEENDTQLDHGRKGEKKRKGVRRGGTERG